MLVVSRKSRESIHIGKSIVVTVKGIFGNKVRLGIEAPKEIPILRAELLAGEIEHPSASLPSVVDTESSKSDGLQPEIFVNSFFINTSRRGAEMSKAIKSTDISQDYTTAYAAHYQTRNLLRAFQLYRAIIVSHPDAPEADHCRMQIQNIIRSVVPKQELLDAQLSLLMSHFEQDRSSSIEIRRTHLIESELTL